MLNRLSQKQAVLVSYRCIVLGLIFSLLFSYSSIVSAAQQSLVFATEPSYPPFEYVDAQGNIQGFDVDVMQALCKQMQAQCKIVGEPWDSLIPSLAMGKFDALIGAIAITKEREKKVDFTIPYYHDSVSFVAPSDRPLQLTQQGMQGKRVGVQIGTVLQQYLQGVYHGAVDVKVYSSQQYAFLDLNAGRLDAVLGDTPLVKDWLKQQPAGKFTLVGQPISDPKYFGPGFGIAVKKGDQRLLNQLNQAIKVLQENGTLEKLGQQYFGSGS